jgi:outer membrane autotransporter protein
MKTSGSDFLRRLRAGFTPRALAAGPGAVDDLRSANSPPALNETRYSSQRVTGVLAAFGLMVVTSTSPSHAQAPPTLGSVAPFAVLGGSTVTNTGPTVLTGTAALPGNLGVSPGSAITGFFAIDGGPGILTGPGASIHQNDAVAIQAQIDLITAYNNLAGRPTTVNLTGQNLGGLTLVPGVYNFSSSAQLTGALTLNGLGNPNSVFIFNIGSTLTTASASTILLINGAQGGNVFWRVGSSATLGTTTSFAGDLLALTSITLNTGATITCGAAWAETGAVTLDTNTISLCNLIAGSSGGSGGSGGVLLGPTGFPLFVSLLPSSANGSQRAVASGLDTAIGSGVTVPLAFVNLATLSPSNLASALSQLQGEASTGTAPAGTQAMNSFLALVAGPFADTRGYTPPPPPPLISKTLAFKAPAEAAPDPSRWGIWTAGYGGQSNANGNALVGNDDRSMRTFGSAIGVDYRITPYTLVGVALAAGGTNYGLSGGFGGGHSDMFQSAVYSFTRINAAYISATLAYAWQRESTDRFLTVMGTDHLTAGFNANNIGGRIEGGYRFAIPGVLPGLGVIPYAALQMQAFHTPAYNEIAASGSSQFALAYNAQTTTTTRTELGTWFDDRIALDNGAILTLRSRAAWAYDHWSNYGVMTAAFQQLPGSSFTETGAAPARDSLLASAGAEISYRNGISLAGLFNTELAEGSRTYNGFLRLRYTW